MGGVASLLHKTCDDLECWVSNCFAIVDIGECIGDAEAGGEWEGEKC